MGGRSIIQSFPESLDVDDAVLGSFGLGARERVKKKQPDRIGIVLWSCLVYKIFQNSLSHRIFKYMYEVLNIVLKNN